MDRPQAVPAGRRDDTAASSIFPTLRRAFRMCRQSHDHCRSACRDRIPACESAAGCSAHAAARIALPDLSPIRRDDGLEACRTDCSQPAQSRLHGICPQHRLGHRYHLSQGRPEMALSHGFHRPVLAHYRWVGLERFARKTFGPLGFSQGLCAKEAVTRPSGPQRQGHSVASCDFQTDLKRHGCVQSMSRKGNCWDNAAAESFFHTLKTQFIRHRRFSDRLEAELALFQYIEAYYNRRRRHSSNGWMSPAEFEKRLVTKEVA